VIRRARGKIAPAFKIVGQKIVGFIRGDDVGVSGVDERERAARRADVDRLPEAVQHQNLTVQRGLQILPSCRLAPSTASPSRKLGAKVTFAVFSVNGAGHMRLTRKNHQISFSICSADIRSNHGGSRISGKRACGTMQFLYSRLGAAAPGPTVHGDLAVLFGGDSLVFLARLGDPSLVDLGRGVV